MTNALEWLLTTMEQYGVWGLALMTFLDSFISPIPPEVFFLPLALMNPENALWLASITIGTSLIGALVGYWLGLKGGRPLLHRFFRKKMIQRAEDFIHKYDVLAVLLISFTPIPFKLITVTAGVLVLPVPKFIFWSALGRGARFLLEAVLIIIYGRAAVEFLASSSFALVTFLIGAVGLIIYFLFQIYYKNKRYR